MADAAFPVTPSSSCSGTMPDVPNLSVPCPAMPLAGWQIMKGSGWGLPGVGSRVGGCWGSTVLDAGCHPRAVAWCGHDPDGCACSWCGGASGPRWPGALHAAACTCTTEKPRFRGWGYDGWPQMMDCLRMPRDACRPRSAEQHMSGCLPTRAATMHIFCYQRAGAEMGDVALEQACSKIQTGGRSALQSSSGKAERNKHGPK